MPKIRKMIKKGSKMLSNIPKGRITPGYKMPSMTMKTTTPMMVKRKPGIIKKVGNFLRKEGQLNKDASAEYNRRMGGPTSDSKMNMREIGKIKKQLRKSRK